MRYFAIFVVILIVALNFEDSEAFWRNKFRKKKCIKDLCDLNLNATDTSVCRGGADKIVSFFVAPASVDALEIECPESPFLVKRRFDCEATSSQVTFKHS